MPYYVSLFLLNDNTITTIPEPASQVNQSVVEEDDGSSVEGILQVRRIGVQCDIVITVVTGCNVCRSSEYLNWRGYSSWAATPQGCSP